MNSPHITSTARHTAVYGLGDLLGRVVSVVLVPLYARRLTLHDNGILSLAFAFIGFTAVLYSLGIHPALIRALSGQKDPAARERSFSSAVWLLLAGSTLFSALIWITAPALSHPLLGTSAHTPVFRFMAAILFLDALSEPLFTLCRAAQRATLYALVRLVQHTLQLGLTVTFILGLNRGVIAVFEANLIGSACALLALLPVGIKHLRPVFDLKTVRELLAFGIPFVPATLSLLIINLSDRFLVEYFLGLESLGIYGITYKLGLPMLLMVRAFRTAWAPAVLSIPDPVRDMCARITTYFCLVAVFLFLGVSAFSHELIVLVAGSRAPTYLPGQNVIPLVTLAFLLYGLYVILTAGIYARGRARMLPVVVGLGAAINLGANGLLLPRIGLVGAAWSTLIAYGAMVLVLFFRVRQFYPVAYEYGRLAKISMAGGVVFLTVSNYLQDLTLEGIIARAIFLLGYPVILWGWRVFEPQEWQDLLTVCRSTMRLKNNASLQQ